jgi:hypothetical protein
LLSLERVMALNSMCPLQFWQGQVASLNVLMAVVRSYAVKERARTQRTRTETPRSAWTEIRQDAPMWDARPPALSKIIKKSQFAV